MMRSQADMDDPGATASEALQDHLRNGLMLASKYFVERARCLLARWTAMQRNTRTPKRLELVETLALGGRRQLFVVVCDNQRYLVGAGAESVGTIVPLESKTGPSEKPVKRPHLVRERGRDTCRIMSADPVRRKSFEAISETGDLWQ